MKSEKGKGALRPLVLLTVLVGFLYLASDSMRGNKIKLGLDLAGGVSITYQTKEENPSSQDMKDTIFRLQRRVKTYSTEAQVYQEGWNRINIDIPGVSDANQILEDFGRPGSLTFADPSGNTILTGDQVKSVKPAQTQNKTTGQSQYLAELVFTEEGSKAFAEATSELIDQRIAIIYDGRTYSGPVAKEAITGDICQIDGMQSYDEADQLASTTRIGSLRLELEELRSNMVSAQLSQQATHTSLKAGVVGFLAIVAIMVDTFWLPGLAASLVLALYISLTVCLISVFDIMMTFPGIVDIILPVGMAVDTNVIIFTRIREEIGLGRSVRDAAKADFHKALSTIVDGNTTTLIAAAVLYIMGTDAVKGFATTLGLGVVVSVFTALLTTRSWVTAFLELGLDKKGLFGAVEKRKTFDFIGRRRFFFGFALVVVASGFIGMGVYQAKTGSALNLGLDFKGGTSINVTLNQDMLLEQIDAEVKPVVAAVTGDNDIQAAKVQGTDEVIIKTRMLSVKERQSLDQALAEKSSVDQEKITMESITGTISGEMRRDMVLAVAIALLLMLVYIRFRFSNFRFVASAIMCLCHDVLVLFAFYILFRWSIGSSFVACILALVGCSINDIIVIFDRICENQKLYPCMDRKELVNRSITETLSHSVLTSLMIFVTIFILFLLGVSSIRNFTLPLMVGTIFDTYSSIAIASPLWNLMGTRHDKQRAETEAAAKEAGKAEKAAKKKKK